MTPNLSHQPRAMHRVALTLLLGAALGFTAGCNCKSATAPSDSSMPMSTNETLPQDMASVQRVQRALIRIHVVSTESSEGRRVQLESAGSGVILTADGYAVTNHHVAGKGTRLRVTLPSREEISADLVGTDAMSDIAVIKLKPEIPTTFPYAEWGDSNSLQVGDRVYALGSPLALSQSVTKGIVSNTQMILPTVFGSERFELDGEDVGSIVRWIGHDAVIQHGNSGGPLVNERGEVVGINEIGYGLGGAIPANLAKSVAADIIRDGEVRRSYLGILFQPRPKSHATEPGALIATVLENSPAEKAGVKPGDRLLEIEGEKINARFAEEIPLLNQKLAALDIGKAVNVTVLRGDKEIPLNLLPVKRERVITPEVEFRALGLTGRNLSVWTQLERSRDSRDGVLVTTTRPGGPAGTAKPNIEGDDILVKIGDDPVSNVLMLEKSVAKITKGQGAPVPTVLEFERESKRFLSVVEVGVKDLDDPGSERARAWVPVDTQVITRELAKALGNPKLKGVRISQTFGSGEKQADSPFKVGDLITALDGEPLQISEAHDSEVFVNEIRQRKVGAKTEFTIQRDGKEQTITYDLPARPKPPREMARYRNLDFGFIVREIAYLDKQKATFTPEDNPRVLVDAVTPGSWAGLARLAVGDLIISIDGGPIASVADVQAALKKAADSKARYVEMKVRRKTLTAFLEIEPLW